MRPPFEHQRRRMSGHIDASSHGKAEMNYSDDEEDYSPNSIYILHQILEKMLDPADFRIIWKAISMFHFRTERILSQCNLYSKIAEEKSKLLIDCIPSSEFMELMQRDGPNPQARSAKGEGSQELSEKCSINFPRTNSKGGPLGWFVCKRKGCGKYLCVKDGFQIAGKSQKSACK
mmetsp:Transcript_24854/g.62133  ORF Transcript_24854/g.62133 Transcript_24854/m.62133 type:complete len:175 (+) Transcript_24854:84-608(+)